jgi:hypothetical protein
MEMKVCGRDLKWGSDAENVPREPRSEDDG